MLVRERISFKKLVSNTMAENELRRHSQAPNLDNYISTLETKPIKVDKTVMFARGTKNSANQVKLPLVAAKSALRRSTIAINAVNAFQNNAKKVHFTRVRTSSLFHNIESSSTLSFPSSFNDNSVQKFSINSLIENFDVMKMKYSNPTTGHLLTMDKLNAFRRKCSLAIAKDRNWLENSEINQMKNAQNFVSNSSSSFFSNTSHKTIDTSKLHIGSLLSSEGQYATLKCLEDTIKTKLRSCILNMSSRAKFRNCRDKASKKIFYHKVYLLKKALDLINSTKSESVYKQPITTTTMQNKSAPNSQQSSQSNFEDYYYSSDINIMQKSIVSKHIESGMNLLDEINSLMKEINKIHTTAATATSTINELKDENGSKIITESNDTDNNAPKTVVTGYQMQVLSDYFEARDNNSSSVLSSEDIEDGGLNFKKIHDLINKLNEWCETWIQVFK